MARTQISTTVSDTTRQQANELIIRCGYSLRDVVTVAVDRLYRQEVEVDRVAQVNWIDQTALDIVDAAPDGFAAGELVAGWVNNPECELPAWFNDHDRELLIERVAHHLAS